MSRPAFGDRDVLTILRGICALEASALKSPTIEDLLDVVRAIRLANVAASQVRFPTREDRAVIAWLADELEPRTIERGNVMGLLNRVHDRIEQEKHYA